MEAEGPFIEPLFESGAPLASGEDQDSEPELSQDHRIHSQGSFVSSKPRDHGRVRLGPGRLAQNVGVDEIFQSESVDSDSIGTKKPFSGHKSNQSRTPALGREARRMSRYSPRSSLSTSN